MKLTSVEIVNFRLLENIEGESSCVNFNDKTTVLVGKNNSGKTSFSYLFDIFLNNKSFGFDDFSIGTYKVFQDLFDKYNKALSNTREIEDFLDQAITMIPSVQLKITIQYDENDNWNNIRPLLTSLEDNNIIKILFEYSVENLQLFLEDLKKCYDSKKRSDNLIDCIKKIYIKHFSVKIRSFSPYENSSTIKLSDVTKIIGSCFISAQRNVDDSNAQTNSKLSAIFQKQYKQSESRYKDHDLEEKEFEELNDALVDANGKVDEKLKNFFETFTRSFSTFGYPNVEGADVVLKSNVTPTSIFNSINLFYRDNEHLLPEKYNGLGYSNLIFIISEILSFKAVISESPKDLNLIFIEEPEAHMHPQLQNTFITKLNEFLLKTKLKAQIILTTHSSHIVSNADFDSIRYFGRDQDGTKIKDLMKFKPQEAEDETIKFLKQYVSLVKCDMFFADKIILIEGVCERLLMTSFIEKIDEYLRKCNNGKLLSEQYIAVIEIGGAYMAKFKEFLEFLNVKTLMITDIDCCKKIEKKNKNDVMCTYEVAYEIKEESIEELVTTNQTIIQWIPKKKKIRELVFLKFENLVYDKFAISYQRNFSETLKCGRTFEEAFIIENGKYIIKNKTQLDSIKNKIKDSMSENDILKESYQIYKYIDSNKKKSEFAFDLMYVDRESWDVPTYIKEGLIWLAK